MIVCVCEGISERTVRESISTGANTLKGVGRSCGAGTDCGMCRARIRQLLRESASTIATTAQHQSSSAARPTTDR